MKISTLSIILKMNPKQPTLKMARRMAALSFTFLLPAAGFAEEPAPELSKLAAMAQPCVIITGDDSQVNERGYHRITSVNEWAMLWQKHTGKKSKSEFHPEYDPLGVPLVDFNHYMVIAIFQGPGMNSAGLKAVSITDEQESVVFRFDDMSYQTVGNKPDGGGIMVSVYGFFVVPRSSKALVLEENAQRLIQGESQWNKCIEFPKL